MALNRSLADLTHEDNMLIPDSGGNCINWVLEHILTVRGLLLLVTGAGAPIFSEVEAAAFKRGPAAFKPGDKGISLDCMKAAL